jgi:hypothetical protein
MSFTSTISLELCMRVCDVQQGIGDVISELVSFTGSEIYVREWSQLQGMTFGDALFAFDGAVSDPLFAAPFLSRHAPLIETNRFTD